MTALTLTLIRLAFLAVLWLFVIAAVGVVRTDLFGNAASSVSSRRQARKQRQARPRPAQPPKPPRPQRSRNPRSAPQQLLVTAGALAGTTLGLARQMRATSSATRAARRVMP